MAANEMKSMGKGEKALKLIEHGIALAPKNPDLLNGYGELIETLQDDILMADQMYFQVCWLIHAIEMTLRTLYYEFLCNYIRHLYIVQLIKKRWEIVRELK